MPFIAVNRIICWTFFLYYAVFVPKWSVIFIWIKKDILPQWPQSYGEQVFSAHHSDKSCDCTCLCYVCVLSPISILFLLLRFEPKIRKLPSSSYFVMIVDVPLDFHLRKTRIILIFSRFINLSLNSSIVHKQFE